MSACVSSSLCFDTCVCCFIACKTKGGTGAVEGHGAVSVGDVLLQVNGVHVSDTRGVQEQLTLARGNEVQNAFGGVGSQVVFTFLRKPPEVHVF